MRCRTHISDPGTGVCARCFRERLSALGVSPVEDDATPTPTIGEKPVFSSSPPALFCPWPLFPDFVDQSSAADGFCGGCEKRRAMKSSFRSPESGKQAPKKREINAIVLKPPASSFSILALILWQRMKNNKKKSSNVAPADEDASRGRSRKPHAPQGRGISPASNHEAEEDGRGLSSPSPWRRKVVAAHPHNAQIQQNPCSVSSFAMCLNPMVRPSPGNRRIHCPAQPASSGQLRGTFIHRSSGGGAAVADASSGFVQNRSRKLVDLGKVW